jgi:hypothetical protein
MVSPETAVAAALAKVVVEDTAEAAAAAAVVPAVFQLVSSGPAPHLRSMGCLSGA